MGFHSNGIIDFKLFDEVESGFILPADYTRLDYIASSGTQYIDTEYYWTSEKVKIEMDAIVTSNSSSQSLFGNEEPFSGGRYFSIVPHGKSGSYGYYVGSNSPLGSAASLTIGERFVMECETTVNKLFTVKVNNIIKLSATYSGTVQARANTTSTNVSKGKIYIFANHNSSTQGTSPIQNVGGMKLYGFKMWDNDFLVRYFVPCKNSSDVVGLYELVEGKFYTTASGTFIAGNVVKTALETDKNVQARILSEQIFKSAEFIEF